jgi:hypothetical protein
MIKESSCPGNELLTIMKVTAIWCLLTYFQALYIVLMWTFSFHSQGFYDILQMSFKLTDCQTQDAQKLVRVFDSHITSDWYFRICRNLSVRIILCEEMQSRVQKSQGSASAENWLESSNEMLPKSIRFGCRVSDWHSLCLGNILITIMGSAITSLSRITDNCNSIPLLFDYLNKRGRKHFQNFPINFGCRQLIWRVCKHPWRRSPTLQDNVSLPDTWQSAVTTQFGSIHSSTQGDPRHGTSSGEDCHSPTSRMCRHHWVRNYIKLICRQNSQEGHWGETWPFAKLM